MKQPRAFISHAHADKARFVRPFAAALRNPGAVAVWVDEWEMKLGDSLVEKICGEGLQAANVIAVVSNHSISSKWVREELNIATVRRIKGKARILPVILDELGEDQIPEVVEHLLWHRVPNPPDDPANIRAATEKVAAAIHGQSHPDKPALAPMPAYALVGEESPQIPGLDKFASHVLASVCECLMDDGDHGYGPIEWFEINEKAAGVLQELKEKHGAETVAEAFDILDHEGMVVRTQHFGWDPHGVTTYGFDAFVESHTPEEELRALCGKVAAFCCNHADDSAAHIYTEFKDVPRMLVIYALRDMEREGGVRIAGLWDRGPGIYIDNKGVLKRYIRNHSDS